MLCLLNLFPPFFQFYNHAIHVLEIKFPNKTLKYFIVFPAKKKRRQLASNTKTSLANLLNFFQLYTAVKSVFRMNNIMLAHAQLPEQYAAKKNYSLPYGNQSYPFLTKMTNGKAVSPQILQLASTPSAAPTDTTKLLHPSHQNTIPTKSGKRISKNISIKRC